MKWPWSKNEPKPEPEVIAPKVYDICPNCRTTLYAKFCTYCGTEGVPPECPKGHKSDVSSNFCGQCGEELRWGRNSERKAIEHAGAHYTPYHNALSQLAGLGARPAALGGFGQFGI